MKKFIVEISHTEYGKIEVEAENEHRAEITALDNIDSANWGNDESEVLGVEEVK